MDRAGLGQPGRNQRATFVEEKGHRRQRLEEEDGRSLALGSPHRDRTKSGSITGLTEGRPAGLATCPALWPDATAPPI